MIPARRGGFTLIELVVTLLIVGLLAAAAVPLVELTVKRNRERELRAALREIRTAIDAYKRASDEGRILKLAQQSGYPPKLALLVEGVPDLRSPERRSIYFLRRLPRDPTFPDQGAPRYLHRADLAKETVLVSDLATMRDAVDKFFGDTGRYPASLDELVARRYLRRIPPDPITESTASWIVVAPPAPEQGAVYDVKSGAQGRTSDGRPYNTL